MNRVPEAPPFTELAASQFGYGPSMVKQFDATGGRYTDNDSWFTNELDVDWQGVTLYHLYFARWWAAGASRTQAAFRSLPSSRK